MIRALHLCKCAIFTFPSRITNPFFFKFTLSKFSTTTKLKIKETDQKGLTVILQEYEIIQLHCLHHTFQIISTRIPLLNLSRAKAKGLASKTLTGQSSKSKGKATAPSATTAPTKFCCHVSKTARVRVLLHGMKALVRF